MLNTIFALEATAAGTDASASASGGDWTSWILPIVMIGAIILMFVFSSRSQKKRDKEVNDMRNSLRVGDEVTTTGGIIGRVVSVKEETVVIETTKDKTKIRFVKAAIRSVDVKAADAKAAKKAAKEAQAAKDAQATKEVAPAPVVEEEQPKEDEKA